MNYIVIYVHALPKIHACKAMHIYQSILHHLKTVFNLINMFDVTYLILKRPINLYEPLWVEISQPKISHYPWCLGCTARPGVIRLVRELRKIDNLLVMNNTNARGGFIANER